MADSAEMQHEGALQPHETGGAKTLQKKEDIPEWTNNLIREHKVVVFQKPGCPATVRTIDTLRRANPEDLHIVNLDETPMREDVENYLQTMTGGRNLPPVFVSGQLVDDLESIMQNPSLENLMGTAVKLQQEAAKSLQTPQP